MPEVRTATHAQRAAFAAIAGHAYAARPDAVDGWFTGAGDANIRVVLDGADVGGGCIVIPCGQAFGGAFVPMLGVAGVAVAGHRLRRGLARGLMAGVLREARERGFPISTLYASVLSLYRRCGYGHAGSRHVATIPGPTLRPVGRTLSVRPVTEDGHSAVKAFYGRIAHGRAGWLDRNAYLWPRILGTHRGHTAHGLWLEGADGPEGYLVYAKVPGPDRHDVQVRDVVVTTRAAADQVWTQLADLAPMCRNVLLPTAPSCPIFMAHPDPRFTVGLADNWYLRITDPIAALQARGWAADGRVDLAIDDPVFGAARVRLDVDGGTARATDGGAGTVRIRAEGLAMLYAGFVDTATLRILGLIDGPAAPLATLDAIARSPRAWMRDAF